MIIMAISCSGNCIIFMSVYSMLEFELFIAAVSINIGTHRNNIEMMGAI